MAAACNVKEIPTSDDTPTPVIPVSEKVFFARGTEWTGGERIWLNTLTYTALCEEEVVRLVEVDAAPHGKFESDSLYQAFYPYGIATQGGGSKYYLPQIQGYPSNPVPLWAESNSETLDFKPLTGVFALKVKSSGAAMKLDCISVKAHKALSGNFKMRDGEPVMLSDLGTVAMYPESEADSEGTVFHFNVPQAKYGGISVDITNEQGESMTYQVPDSVSVVRGEETAVEICINPMDFIADNSIIYFTDNGSTVTPHGLSPLSNSYENGRGVMTFESAVTALPHHCFNADSTDSAHLTGIVLPHKLSNVGNYAFNNCSALESVDFDTDVVTVLGNYAFQNCSSLKEIHFPENAKFVNVMANLLFGCSSITELYVPDNVTKISNNAFQNCSSLTNIRIPGHITNLPQNTFNGCEALTSLDLPEALTTVGIKAFAMSGLENITIPAGVANIPVSLFMKCARLETITLLRDSAKDGSITTLANVNAFTGCTALNHISVVPEDVDAYKVAENWSNYSYLFDPSTGDDTDLESAEYSMSVKLDHSDCIYAVGEDIVASVSVSKDGEPFSAIVECIKSKDNYSPTIEKSNMVVNHGEASVVMKLNEPGFMMLRINFKTPAGNTLSKIVGAGVDVYNIGRSMPEPDDFVAYWDQQRELQAKVPENLTLTQVDSKKRGIVAYDVQAECLGGHFSAYIAHPENAEVGSLPAMVLCHGAGVASSRLSVAVKWAEEGLIAIDFNVHGLPNGQSSEYYQNLGNKGGELFQYYYKGTYDRDSVFFRKVILRLMKAMDIVTARPEWDGTHLISYGRSQGGAQALIAGGIDPRVELVCAEIPALCDLTGALVGRSSGWPRYQEYYKGQFPEKDQNEVRYIDAMNFAGHIKGKVFATCGYIDVSCPPTGVFAAYNTIPGEKHMRHNTDTGHVTTKEGEEFVNQAVLDYLSAISK